MPSSSTQNAANTTYDEIPYQGSAFPQTHPDRLATLGLLFGLSPAPVTQCRVLELGCASGGNLIPMAYYLPGQRVRRVDLSTRQVETACQGIEDLGLQNIRVGHTSILDVDANGDSSTTSSATASTRGCGRGPEQDPEIARRIWRPTASRT